MLIALQEAVLFSEQCEPVMVEVLVEQMVD